MLMQGGSMKFIVAVVDGKQIYFRGRMSIDLKELSEGEINKLLNAFVEVGKEYICKHFKNKISPLQVRFVKEDFSLEDVLIFEYAVGDRPFKVLYKRVGPIGYALARFFTFI